MNDRHPSPPEAGDDWLDALLTADAREHRTEYLDDAGFTARVMSALPASEELPAWRKPAVAALWACVGMGIALALPGTVADVSHEILRVILGQRISLTGIGAGVLVLGAAAWAAAALALRDA